jgi:hypothetical protein
MMCGENPCNVFLLLFMILWVPISATLCMRAMLMLWHAFLFLGLRLFPMFFSVFGGLRCFSCKKILSLNSNHGKGKHYIVHRPRREKYTTRYSIFSKTMTGFVSFCPYSERTGKQGKMKATDVYTRYQVPDEDKQTEK